MISPFISMEAFLSVVVRSRSAAWQVRDKYKSPMGRKYLSDQDIQDCISIAIAVTLKRHECNEVDVELFESDIQPTNVLFFVEDESIQRVTKPKKKPRKPFDDPQHAENYFFATLWTKVSETYYDNNYHGNGALEFNEDIGNSKLNPGIASNDLSNEIIAKEAAAFIMLELKKIETSDIEKRDSMLLNKMKNHSDPVIKKFSRDTIEMLKHGYSCEKRIIYIRSLSSDDEKIKKAAIECMSEISLNESVSNLVNYSLCKTYNKKYLETKTLHGLIDLMAEGNSISQIAEMKGRVADPIRQKIKEMKISLSERLDS